jgi:hypothetical protein
MLATFVAYTIHIKSSCETYKLIKNMKFEQNIYGKKKINLMIKLGTQYMNSMKNGQ